MTRTLKQFSNEKQQCLNRIDRSVKGSIDEPIVELVDRINSSVNFYTTSSCSGRIIITCKNGDNVPDFSDSGDEKSLNPVKKKNILWQFLSHSIIENVQQDLVEPFLEYSQTNSCQTATLKFESFILHVRCSDLESAQKLLTTAVESGLRNSGLMISSNGHLTVAIRNTLNLEVPLIVDKHLMVSDAYLAVLGRIVNVKMADNFKLIQRFSGNCSQKNIFSSI